MSSAVSSSAGSSLVVVESSAEPNDDSRSDFDESEPAAPSVDGASVPAEDVDEGEDVDEDEASPEDDEGPSDVSA